MSRRAPLPMLFVAGMGASGLGYLLRDSLAGGLLAFAALVLFSWSAVTYTPPRVGRASRPRVRRASR